MRNLFSSPATDPAVPEATPSANTGWNNLSGWVKLSIVGGVAVAGIAVVMWPSFTSKTAVTQTANVEQHSASRISEFEQPPAGADVIDRATGNTNTAAPAHYRPHPTEMALYSAPVSLISTQANAQQARAANGDPESGDPSVGGGNSPLTASLAGATTISTSRATIVRHPDYLIRPGDSIPCLPIEANDSSRPGFASCRVTGWYRSSNQRRGLLPPGTRIFGQIRSGLAQNEERLGILYTLIETRWFDQPIAAPGADTMGRPGVDGDLHTFFWDRLGAVALYSLLDVAVGTGQNLASSALSKLSSNGGTSISVGGPAQSLAGREFDATINKPPVVRRDWSLPLTVTVGQNLDFYDACMQAMKVDAMACPLMQ